MSKLVNSELIVKADDKLQKSIADELNPKVETEKEPSPQELEEIIKKYHKESNQRV